MTLSAALLLAHHLLGDQQGVGDGVVLELRRFEGHHLRREGHGLVGGLHGAAAGAVGVTQVADGEDDQLLGQEARREGAGAVLVVIDQVLAGRGAARLDVLGG